MLGETVAIRRTFFRFTEGIKRFEKEGEIVCVQGVKRRILNICANARKCRSAAICVVFM